MTMTRESPRPTCSFIVLVLDRVPSNSLNYRIAVSAGAATFNVQPNQPRSKPTTHLPYPIDQRAGSPIRLLLRIVRGR